MAVLQRMKKTPNMKTVSDLQDAFIRRIEWMMIGCNEGCVVFDRYLDQSLKAKTRQWRAVTSVEYVIYPKMKLTMSLKELLSSSKNRSSLTSMIGKGVLQNFLGNSTLEWSLSYETKIKDHNFEEQHSHEEADTLIPNQVLAFLATNDGQEKCVLVS